MIYTIQLVFVAGLIILSPNKNFKLISSFTFLPAWVMSNVLAITSTSLVLPGSSFALSDFSLNEKSINSSDKSSVTTLLTYRISSVLFFNFTLLRSTF